MGYIGCTGYVWRAARADGRWTKEPIDTTGRRALHDDDVGRDGRPILPTNQELGIYRLLRYTETGWNQSIISKVDGDGRAGRLFESKDGRLHLVYLASMRSQYSYTDLKGTWHHEVITQEAQVCTPCVRTFSFTTIRATVMYGDARMVKTGLERAERDLKGWTVTSVDTHKSPKPSVKFVGQGRTRPPSGCTASTVVRGSSSVRRGKRRGLRGTHRSK